MGKLISEVRRFAVLDVHAETVAAAVAEKDGEVRALGIASGQVLADCKP